MARGAGDSWRGLSIKLSAGSELWVVVSSGSKTFRMPAHDSVEKLCWGLVDGWDMSQEKGRGPRDRLTPDTRALLKLWQHRYG
jgi:hypothetical protein